MKKRPGRKKEKWDKEAIIFVLPYIIFCLLFMIYPVFMAIAGSFAKWDLVTNSFTKFIGLDNYIRLFQDSAFWLAVRNSFIYFAVQIPTSILGGMAFASILNRNFFGRDLFRGIYFLPVVTGSVIISIIWKWLLQSSNGMINYLLEAVGLPGVTWLADPKMSMLSISLVKAWMDIGYYTVIFLAAYQGISRDYIDAARIDGANGFQIFRRIKLPLLNPTIMFCIMMATIWAFQLFNEPYIMTEGGPMGSSTTMSLYLYRQGFIFHDMSYASAIGVVVGLLIMMISVLENKFFKRDIE